jgi:fermentation-respiration switch protein FrsA (DUF1100 family)
MWTGQLRVRSIQLTSFARRIAVGALMVMASGACTTARPPHMRAAPARLGADDVRFVSGSGSVLHAWLAHGRPGGGAVLLLHGVHASRESMLGRAQFLHDAGFTVLAPDFQAHGDSRGEHITYGALESLDAVAALAYLRAVVPEERVGVIGVSMGGAASLLGPGPLAANAFVLESVYPTIRQALGNRLARWFGPVGRWVTSPVIDVLGAEIGVSESELQPITRIASIGAPLLLINGSADRYTPLAEAESLFARAPMRKTFWAIAGAGHEDLHRFNRVEYERRVGGFLTQCLRAHGC